MKPVIKKDAIKVLLIYPPTGTISTYNTPTGLLYIATVLKHQGYRVKLVDCSVEPQYQDVLDREIVDTDLLGVYAMSVHIRHLLPELRRLKEKNPRVKIVWGGPHAILFPEQTARSPFADIVVPGEGEDVMLDLVRGVESGKLDLHQVGGICFKENGGVVSTPVRPFVDVNQLPILDWSMLKPEVLDVVKRSIIRVQASRGCPYRCAFCINVLTKNRKMRYRDPLNVLKEIDFLSREFNIQRVGFRDEVFMSNRQQVRDIAQGLLDRNIRITWLANPRVEYLRESYVKDDYLKLLADSGCNKLQCGGESGSQRILELLHKGIKVDDVLNFVRRTKRFNIIPLVAFMTGIPTETKAEQMQTLRLIREILRIQPRAFINGPANYRPYPGGELYDMCVRDYGLKMPDTLEEWEHAEILGGSRPPWVQDMTFNQFLWTSTKASTNTPAYVWQKIRQNPFKGLAIFFLTVISKLRMRWLFYRFPFEFYLLDFYYSRIRKQVPEMS